MELIFEKGNQEDIDELETLYDDLNDHLKSNVNYPGWIKGIYPTRKNAAEGIEQGTLHVARYHGKIAGSVILSHIPEAAYATADWIYKSPDYSDVFVIYTFVVHPAFLSRGVGSALMEYVVAYSINAQMRSLRLDVYEKNLPAIQLYEKSGFQYVASVDLGLGHYGLEQFKLYEKVL